MKKTIVVVIMILTISQVIFARGNDDGFRLKNLLKGTTWEWSWTKEKIKFKNNGYIGHPGWERKGLATSWKVIDEHTVLLTVTKGRRMDKYAILIFNDDFLSYSGYDFHNNSKIKTSKKINDGVIKNQKRIKVSKKRIRVNKKNIIVDEKTKAKARKRKDLKVYSREQLKEIESLYQVANKKWRSQEAIDSLKLLVANYKNANRTGCALLYLGQMIKGDEKIKYLKQAINGFSDCFYGDGVQVGAYARYRLLLIYMRNGNKVKAYKLIQEIKTDYPNAIDHRGNSLVAIIDREFNKNK